MSDWIKLPSGRFVNLDLVSTVGLPDRASPCRVIYVGTEKLDDEDVGCLLAALEARCTRPVDPEPPVEGVDVDRLLSPTHMSAEGAVRNLARTVGGGDSLLPFQPGVDLVYVVPSRGPNAISDDGRHRLDRYLLIVRHLGRIHKFGWMPGLNGPGPMRTGFEYIGSTEETP